jgi:hypothetical protein
MISGKATNSLKIIKEFKNHRKILWTIGNKWEDRVDKNRLDFISDGSSCFSEPSNKFPLDSCMTDRAPYILESH